MHDFLKTSETVEVFEKFNLVNKIGENIFKSKSDALVLQIFAHYTETLGAWNVRCSFASED